jgi:hypothetical protein
VGEVLECGIYIDIMNFMYIVCMYILDYDYVYIH